jgi:hypothetical protein
MGTGGGNLPEKLDAIIIATERGKRICDINHHCIFLLNRVLTSTQSAESTKLRYLIS